MITNNVIKIATKWAIKENIKEKWANKQVKKDKSGQIDIIKEDNKIFVRQIIETPLGEDGIYSKVDVIDKKELNI